MCTNSEGKYLELDTVATGHRIKRLMQEKHLCIKDVSRIMNVSFQAIYRWQRGETLPTISNLFILGQLMRMDVDDMLVAKEKTDVIRGNTRRYSKVQGGRHRDSGKPETGGG